MSERDCIHGQLARQCPVCERDQRIAELEAENVRLRLSIGEIVETFEAVIHEADRPKGGMQVPFGGDFEGALRLPSVMRAVRWWAKRLRAALAKEE
jgi:hypothetical protein